MEFYFGPLYIYIYIFFFFFLGGGAGVLSFWRLHVSPRCGFLR